MCSVTQFHTWYLGKKYLNFYLLFCFRPDVRQARQRWLFSGILLAMFFKLIFQKRNVPTFAL